MIGIRRAWSPGGIIKFYLWRGLHTCFKSRQYHCTHLGFLWIGTLEIIVIKKYKVILVTCGLTMYNFRITRDRYVIFWHPRAMLVQCPHHTYLKKLGIFTSFTGRSTKYQLSVYSFFFGVCRLVEIISFILGQRKWCDIWHVWKNHMCPFKSDEERKWVHFLQREFSFGILCLHSKWQTLILLANSKLWLCSK